MIILEKKSNLGKFAFLGNGLRTAPAYGRKYCSHLTLTGKSGLSFSKANLLWRATSAKIILRLAIVTLPLSLGT